MSTLRVDTANGRSVHAKISRGLREGTNEVRKEWVLFKEYRQSVAEKRAGPHPRVFSFEHLTANERDGHMTRLCLG